VKDGPDPISTGGVELPSSLLALTERLARQIHDLWAARRLSEGWRYGPARDDEAMTHPCLVPYEDLSESEKDYDRQTALEALRTIVALGYRIIPPGGD
jgi:hypothetical protein